MCFQSGFVFTSHLRAFNCCVDRYLKNGLILKWLLLDDDSLKKNKKTFNVYYSKYVTQMIFSWWSNVNHFCSFCLTNLNYLCHLLLNNIENIVKKIIISALFCLSALCSFTRSLCNKTLSFMEKLLLQRSFKMRHQKDLKACFTAPLPFFSFGQIISGRWGFWTGRPLFHFWPKLRCNDWTRLFFVLSLVLSHEKEEHRGLQKHVDVLAWTKS